jgi:plastocyanin
MRKIVIGLVAVGIVVSGCSAKNVSSGAPTTSPSASAQASDSLPPRTRPLWPQGAVVTSRPSAPATATFTVRAPDNDVLFTPDVVYIKKGGKVTWQYLHVTGEIPQHNVTFTDGPEWQEYLSSSTPTASRVFSTPGTYHYICTIHPPMVGEIIVSA